MPQVWIQWLPQLAITALPGLINLWLSGADWDRRLAEFPIFRQLKSIRLWWLAGVQFFLPAVLFWWIVPFVFRVPPPAIDRPITPELVGSAIGFGWGFVALLNVPISILSAGILDIGPVYALFVEQVFEKISADMQPRMRQFWRELEDELSEPSRFCDRGLIDVASCLGIPNLYDTKNDDNLKAETRLIKEKLLKIQRYRQFRKKAEDLVRLLRTESKISVQSWPDLLLSLGCRPEFIQVYFPPSVRQRSRRP